MIIRKLGFAEAAAALLENLRKNTDYPCYDAVPDDAPSPFLYAEITGKRDSSSKTMLKETFLANVHCIAEPGDARTQIYQMIQAVEQSMTEEIELPPPITLVMQSETGVQSVQMDETNEWHAVIGFEITASYGWKVK